MQKEHIIINDELVLVKPKDWISRPVDCPVCCFALRDQTDVISYEKWKCCTVCRDMFAYQNKEKWTAGWRPTKEDVLKALGQ